MKAFYEKCLYDPMISHFFMGVDHDQLVSAQFDFVSGLLGGPKAYRGKALTAAHGSMTIRPPHFLRRQRLLAETMAEVGLDAELSEAWLALEERLRPLIMNDAASCSD